MLFRSAIIHLSTELFMEKAGIRMTHVPYRGGGPALNDVIAGQISLVFAPPQTGLPQAKAGRVRALAVTAKEPLAAEPDIPGMVQSGLPDFEVLSWHALIGPKGLPQAVIERVNRDIGKTVQSREVEARVLADGVSPAASTPEVLRARLQQEVPMWKSVVSRARIRLD